jgi:pSer/pThr/pTyr-binding forkhead associated (FHA) protein
MKVRLQVSTGAAAFPFEHAGPVVHVGRDPQCELPFMGDVGQTVSWSHARITLTPRGATLEDQGSSNGTFLNDQRIEGRVPLRQGDAIKLGHTGPVLQVVALDLAETPVQPAAVASAVPRTVQERVPAAGANPAGRGSEAPAWARPISSRPAAQALDHEAQRSRQTLAIGIGMAVVSALFLGGVLIWVLNRPTESNSVAHGSSNPPVTEPTPGGNHASESTAKSAAPPAPVENPESQKKTDKNTAVVALPKKETEPLEKPQAVGRYAAQPKAASILLERPGELSPWIVMRPEDRISTSLFLTSLPGYRSKVYLDNGVHLTLWGNVPEFSKFPVLESTIMLHAPAAGLDLELTLDHGRVLLANYKEKGEVRIRAHFRQETWDITLPDNQSEAVLELWGYYPLDVPFAKDSAGPAPVISVGLFLKGQGRVKTRDREYNLSGQSRMAWTSANPTPFEPKTLEKLPDWWTNTLDTKDWHIGEMVLTLQDYAARLKDKESLVDAISTEIQETDASSVKNRTVGVLFLGAMEAIPEVVDLLGDRRYAEVRVSAAFALRHWRALRKENDPELSRILQAKLSKEKAEIILHLLHGFSSKEINQPETYQTLLGYLNHESLAIRELALYHLTLLVPEGAQKIQFAAAADAEKRKPAYEAWKKLLPPGTVPPRPVAPAGK